MIAFLFHISIIKTRNLGKVHKSKRMAKQTLFYETPRNSMKFHENEAFGLLSFFLSLAFMLPSCVCFFLNFFYFFLAYFFITNLSVLDNRIMDKSCVFTELSEELRKFTRMVYYYQTQKLFRVLNKFVVVIRTFLWHLCLILCCLH